jgi:hypothetical protein
MKSGWVCVEELSLLLVCTTYCQSWRSLPFGFGFRVSLDSPEKHGPRAETCSQTALFAPKEAGTCPQKTIPSDGYISLLYNINYLQLQCLSSYRSRKGRAACHLSRPPRIREEISRSTAPDCCMKLDWIRSRQGCVPSLFMLHGVF